MVTTLFFLPVLSWYIAATLTLISQNALVDHQNQKLQPLVEDQLIQQAKLSEQREIIRELGDWRTEHGFVPEALGTIAKVLNLWAAGK